MLADAAMRLRPKFHRYSELNAATVNRDFQNHTSWTDGRNTVAEMLAAAAERGLAEFAFTEHARATSTYYPEFFAHIDDLAPSFRDLRIYRGFEVKVIDLGGVLDISDEMRARADLVLGSVHSFPGDGTARVNPRQLDAAQAQRLEFDMARALVSRRCGAVLSHPGGMSLRNFGAFPAEYFEELIRMCAQWDVPFEINLSYHRPVLGTLAQLLARYDPPMSIGSDSHSVADVATCRDALKELLL